MTTAFDRGIVPEITLRHRLRIAREHAGYEQSELAMLMGVSRGTISNAENGKGEPQRSTINLWAMACGVPAVWIATGNHPDGGPEPTSGLRIISTDDQKVIQLRPVISAVQDSQQVPQPRAS